MDGFNTALTSSAFTGSDAGDLSSPIHGDAQDTTTAALGGGVFIWPGSNVSTMEGNPTTFITQVHLWNNYGICVAIATLSKPLQKNFDREAIIKVKLEY